MARRFAARCRGGRDLRLLVRSALGLLVRISYGNLLGDAADSPIVREEGSRHQGLAGLALSYSF
ncbi:MipA/OmpV family protein [Sphingobium sp. AS12]|uniref:MipA/OmpV family protein n=1 Tax=Sphingobium sp. AS12 TaxID=2849495 RepID=UPI0020C834BA|nr:MipA/OmpV family protein [Sphingobium sp. AS12]